MQKWKDKLFANLCSSFQLGYSPFAPGTVGSLPAVAVYVAIAIFAPPEYHTALLAVMLLISSALCVLLGPWAESYWKKKDPRFVVLDEHAGFYLTVLLFRTHDILLTALWTFVMTRIFDILKPPPARQMEVLPHGWGVLMDDLMASLYAAGVLHILCMLFPRLFGGV
jgi:phosphatidylglycerophosphatase A